MVSIEKQEFLSYERASQLLNYDPNTGQFIWKIGVGRVKSGSIAGYKRRNGYYIIMMDKRKYSAHRVAWLLMNKKWPDNLIDHIDGNPSNNIYSNLRDVTETENQQNQRAPHSRNKSLSNIPGVSIHRNKWIVRLKINDILYRSEKFDSQLEAEAHCLEVRRKHYKGNII